MFCGLLSESVLGVGGAIELGIGAGYWRGVLAVCVGRDGLCT